MKREGENSNDFGVASVVLGIVGIGLLSPVSILIAIVGIIFSLKQKRHYNNKWARNGLILNIVSIILGILAIVLVAYSASNYFTQIQGISG